MHTQLFDSFKTKRLKFAEFPNVNNKNPMQPSNNFITGL